LAKHFSLPESTAFYVECWRKGGMQIRFNRASIRQGQQKEENEENVSQ
jgi:hypothetical protein